MIRNVVFIFVNNIHDSISQIYEIRISIADSKNEKIKHLKECDSLLAYRKITVK